MEHVCPWWGGYFIDNPLRRLLHNPEKILGPHVAEGMTVLDFGCGMGLFSIAMAKLAGPDGRVISMDLQPQMLHVVERRARKAGVGDRVTTHACLKTSIDLSLETPADFALAFYAAHEAPDFDRLIGEMAANLRNGARFLLVEPVGHVPRKQFAGMIESAAHVGFVEIDRPKVRWSHTVLLEKGKA